MRVFISREFGKISPACRDYSRQARVADSNSKNAVSFSSARTTNCFLRRDARLRSRSFVPRNPRLRYSPNSNRALLSLFAAQTLATTVKRFGAVSSVVERLVYTERVGGSNPSPPILHFSIFDLRLNSSRKHMSDGGFDMDLCCVEKWDAVVNRIAKN